MNYKNNKINKIPELKIGDGKLKKRFEINLGWKRFTITVRW